MSEKKSYKAELESRKINFFLLGCIGILSLTWFCLDLYATPEQEIVVVQDEAEAAKVEEYIPPETDQPEQQPEQQQEVQQQNVELILEMVDNSKQPVDISDLFVDQTDENAELVDFVDEGPTEEVVEVEPPQMFTAHMPEFPGGQEALKEYLLKETKYPDAARNARAQGVVAIQFVVEKDGSISNVTVLSPVFPALDEEAKRVVKEMPKWKPGEDQVGKKVRVFYRVPITFSLQ